MANPSIKLEEQLSDLRSDQIAYKLTIENNDMLPIRLLLVEPRIPVGATLLEITDTSLAEANARKVELQQELNNLLRQYLWITSSSFRQTWIERQRDAIKEMTTFAGIFRIYLQTIFESSAYQARMKREFESIAFKIASASDARNAYDRWLASTNEYETIRSLFEAKTAQLERVEALMDENDKSALTSIEPSSYFAATYVLRLSQRFLEPRKYQVAFDATYVQADSTPKHISTATNVQVSPKPWSLTTVAVIAAVLGVLLRISLGGSQNPIDEMGKMANSGQLLVGPVVALIFFNGYEYTSLGKNISMPVSWRSALLIGALCGLAQDRILASLKALIGA